MVVVVVMRMHVGAGVRMFTVEHGFARVHLRDSLSPIITSMSETRERTVIHWVDVLRVGDPRHGVIVPIQITRLNCRFESRENFQIQFQGTVLVGV